MHYPCLFNPGNVLGALDRILEIAQLINETKFECFSARQDSTVGIFCPILS